MKGYGQRISADSVGFGKFKGTDLYERSGPQWDLTIKTQHTHMQTFTDYPNGDVYYNMRFKIISKHEEEETVLGMSKPKRQIFRFY
ncbi:MAG: hypothetical protein ACKO96_37010, partial [Flammeovirgaceae bacterium]